MKIKFVFLLFLFITQSVFADFICDIDITDYYAVYEINSYTCNVGQFLPANTLGCVSCPNGLNCPCGTFDFNPDIFQGLSLETIPNNTMNNICANNFPGNLFAIYEPNQHICSAGYYLPANIDECRPCLLNHYCTGGTYTFNETTDQGIEECPSMRPFAPVNSNICYAHILHVGNDIIYLRSNKLTTPSLNVGLNNDVFYANMTTTPTYMTAGSSHYFKTIYNNQTYYICDATTYGN